MAVQEGSVLSDKFRLVRLIASGGMGAVWEAEHLEIHSRLAVKLLKPELATNEDSVARFRREARIAGSIGHDNICSVLDVGVLPDGGHYLVMPLLRGASLSELLRGLAPEPLPAARSLDITAQILDALVAAHAAGVVHRDLKPGNVYITQVGDRADFVKVLDFGISKITGQGLLRSSNVTETGALLGTPRYMSPEQARGSREVDHRVDVYAAGAILYEMLVGRRAHDGENLAELLFRVAMGRFDRPRDVRPEIAPELEAIVLRAMALEVQDRYPDARAMRADLLAMLPPREGSTSHAERPRAAVADAPTLDAPPTPRPDRTEQPTVGPPTPPATSLARSLSGRRRRWRFAIVALVLALAAGAYAFERMRPEAEPARREAAERPTAKRSGPAVEAPSPTSASRPEPARETAPPPPVADAPSPSSSKAPTPAKSHRARPRPVKAAGEVGDIPILRENE